MKRERSWFAHWCVLLKAVPSGEVRQPTHRVAALFAQQGHQLMGFGGGVGIVAVHHQEVFGICFLKQTLHGVPFALAAPR